MDITKAVRIWNERLSVDCRFRFIEKCNHGRGGMYCQIQSCPILGHEAKLEMKVTYTFTDMKI